MGQVAPDANAGHYEIQRLASFCVAPGPESLECGDWVTYQEFLAGMEAVADGTSAT